MDSIDEDPRAAQVEDEPDVPIYVDEQESQASTV